MNLSLDLTTTKFAGIAISSTVELTLDNCSFNGEIESSGSVYLLFETV